MMQRAGAPSWRIEVERKTQRFDLALWTRDAHAIPMSGRAHGPGPLTPEVAVREPRPELAQGWAWWWETLLDELVSGTPSRFTPPDFAALAEHPDLRELIRSEARAALDWSKARARPAVAHPPEPVIELARRHDLGTRAITLLVLPVEGDVVPARDECWLVPEAVYDGPGWLARLDRLLSSR